MLLQIYNNNKCIFRYYQDINDNGITVLEFKPIIEKKLIWLQVSQEKIKYKITHIEIQNLLLHDNDTIFPYINNCKVIVECVGYLDQDNNVEQDNNIEQYNNDVKVKNSFWKSFIKKLKCLRV